MALVENAKKYNDREKTIFTPLLSTLEKEVVPREQDSYSAHTCNCKYIIKYL